jgi:YfiH family protein
MLIISAKKKNYKNAVGMKLMHGNNVAVVGKKDAGKIIENCDGLITNSPEIVLKLPTADCIPVSFFDPITNSIGLVHAGWRGLHKGVIGRAIALMVKKLKVKSKNLIVFVGSFICQNHYEVKNDVSKLFYKYPKVLKNIGGKTYLDLGGVAKKQLTDAGVKAKNIWFDGRCTYEDKNLFSYRRGDKGKYIYYFLKIPD